MRKSILLFTLLALTFCGKAQFNTVEFTPATFTGEDSVTLKIDLSGTTLAGESEVYIWAFANKDVNNPQYPFKDGITTNTNWGNSPADAKFTNVGGNVWTYKFLGSGLFGLTAGQLKHFQFLVKTKTGNKQTADSPPFTFAPIVYVPRLYRVFPERVNQDDAITIYFDQRLASTLTETRMTATSVTVTLYSDATTVYGASKTFPLTVKDDKLTVSKTFIPTFEWNIPATTDLSKFTYVINGTSYDQNGVVITVQTAAVTQPFDDLR